jgi:xanthine dehydrogenase molybdenum-binding subunit
MANLNVVGKSATRPDAYDKVTGGKGFPVNVSLPGMLHAKLVRSPYAHARITSIDASRALKLKGVKAVLLPDEVAQRPFNPVYFAPVLARSMVLDFVIMSNTVRFVGQPVAAVAATTPDIAEAAAELIDVDYEELPAIFDPVAAMEDGAPQLHAHAPNNVAKNPVLAVGDLDKGFEEADHVFEGTYHTQRVHTCYMEPRVCVVDYDAQHNVTAHSSMQHVFGLREKLAYVLNLPEGKVRVVKPPYIGGGFGGKLDIGHLEPIAALLSRKTARPVRIEHTRAEDFITTARHAIKVHLKTGIKKDGTFTARYAKSILDTGAHATHGAEVIMVHGLYGFFFPYVCPHASWEGYTVYTNNMIGGGYRGYGAPQACFAVESQIDEICDELGLDPIEFRIRNTRKEGDPHPVLQGANLDSYRFGECLYKGAERFGYEAGKPAANGSTRRRGVGFACHPLWVSGCVGFPDIYEHSGAIVKINPDGSADLATACVDLGSGQNVTLCQIVAEELGIEAGDVRLTYADSNTVPFDAPTHASRATYAAGNAVKAAAAEAKQRLRAVAANLLEANPADLEVAGGKVFVKGSPETSVTVAEVSARAESPFIQFTDQGPVPTDLKEKGSIIGVSSLAPPSNPSPCAALFVEVEVDTDTGVVDVLRAVYAHDLGRTINPLAAEGQVEGGLQQGLGYALMENLQFDPDTGACVSGDFLDYKIPTAVEMPRQIESVFIESNEPSGPFGAKSLSELCVVVPAPAIANAIYNATGVRVRDLPITPEKILAGLGKL